MYLIFILIIFNFFIQVIAVWCLVMNWKLQKDAAKPTVKQHLAAIRSL